MSSEETTKRTHSGPSQEPDKKCRCCEDTSDSCDESSNATIDHTAAGAASGTDREPRRIVICVQKDTGDFTVSSAPRAIETQEQMHAEWIHAPGRTMLALRHINIEGRDGHEESTRMLVSAVKKHLTRATWTIADDVDKGKDMHATVLYYPESLGDKFMAFARGMSLDTATTGKMYICGGKITEGLIAIRLQIDCMYLECVRTLFRVASDKMTGKMLHDDEHTAPRRTNRPDQPVFITLAKYDSLGEMFPDLAAISKEMDLLYVDEPGSGSRPRKISLSNWVLYG